MSGSGGGIYMPPQRNDFDCETSIIISKVSSIDIVVLEKHTDGDVLHVVIGDKGQVLLEDKDGEILGAILHSNTSDLIECIENGSEYVAEIRNIDSQVCTVKIMRS